MAEYAEFDQLRLFKINSELSSAAADSAKDRDVPTLAQHPPISEDDSLKSLQALVTSSGCQDDLMRWSQTSPDAWLLRFLRARKWRVSAAFDLLTCYNTFRQVHARLLFASYNTHSPAVRAALRDGFPGVLPERDAHGRTVMLLFPTRWDPDQYDLSAVFRAVFLSLDRLLLDVSAQTHGFVLVVDFSGFTARQCRAVPVRVLKLFVSALQDGYPARIAAVHIVNQPWYVEALLAVVRPFLKPKSNDKMRVHGNNLAPLYDGVSRRILPAELGGDAPSYNSQRWADIMIDG